MCQSQYSLQWDFMLAPFEYESATRFKNPETFPETFAQHFFPAREKASVVFQNVTLPGRPFSVVRRVHYYMEKRFIWKRKLSEVSQNIRLNLDYCRIFPALPWFFVFLFSSVNKYHP